MRKKISTDSEIKRYDRNAKIWLNHLITELKGIISSHILVGWKRKKIISNSIEKNETIETKKIWKRAKENRQNLKKSRKKSKKLSVFQQLLLISEHNKSQLKKWQQNANAKVNGIKANICADHAIKNGLWLAIATIWSGRAKDVKFIIVHTTG